MWESVEEEEESGGFAKKCCIRSVNPYSNQSVVLWADDWVTPDVTPAPCRASDRLSRSFVAQLIFWRSFCSSNEVAEMPRIPLDALITPSAVVRESLTHP